MILLFRIALLKHVSIRVCVNRQFANGNRQLTIGNRQFAICNWQSAIGNRQLTIGNSQFAIGNLQLTVRTFNRLLCKSLVHAGYATARA